MTLRKTTFGEQIDSGILPSGVPFVLKPDTVENGLKVAEAKDSLKWREKLLQVMAITESVGGVQPKMHGGIDFLGSLLDTDVVFLALAWTADVNGRTLKLGTAFPCPHCAVPFDKVDLSQLSLMVRDEPAAGAAAIQVLNIDKAVQAKLPESVRSGTLLSKDPTWREARSRVPATCADDTQVVDTHRAMSALMVAHDGKPPRAVTKAESNQFPMKALQEILRCMDENVPNFTRELQFNCAGCGEEIDIPFDRAGS